MGYINWGNESAAQLEIRKRIEQEMIFEQVSAAAAAAVAAGGGGFMIDKDAKAFAKAAQLNNVTLKFVNILVKSLKKNNLWNKLGAIYPMVGGNATAHSYNLKDTTKFGLMFFGGWTHSSTGAKPNGSNAYATTGFNPVTQGFSNTNAHISYFVQSPSAGVNGRVTGISNGTDDQPIYIIPRYTNGNLYMRFGGAVPLPSESPTVSDGRGFVQLNRNGLIMNGSKDGVVIATSTQTITSITNLDFYLGCGRVLYYGNYRYTTQECSFASFGDSLSVNEAAKYYEIVQEFQNNLQRQI